MSREPRPGGGTAQRPAPTWRVVCSRELRDLWIGGRALYLVLIYSVVLGIYSYLFASNAELELLSVRDMLVEIVKASVAMGLFMNLIIGADSVSGERERATLETLLLTPTSRRQIVVGKFLAALSPWPLALAIAIPYWTVLARGDAVLGEAVLWGSLTGTLLAPALTAVGMLASLACGTNRTSMLVGTGVYLLLLLPNELIGGPAHAQRSAEQWARADLQAWINPVGATSRFLSRVLVAKLPPAELWSWFTMPVLFVVLVLAALFLYAGPRLALEAGAGGRLRRYLGPIGAFWDRASEGARRAAAVAAKAGAEEREDAGVPAAPTFPMRRADVGTGDGHPPNPQPIGASRSARSVWWIVFAKEARDLWIGGKALYLTLLYTVVLGVFAYLLARDSVMSLVPPQEMVFETLKVTIAVSLFVCLIIGADGLSGERERATLEGLLLTPTSRRQIVVGKFLAAVSPWPAALLLTIPYWNVLSQGSAEILGQTMLWGAILGSVLAPALAGLGMLASFWSNSNKTSMFVALGLYLFLMLPTQLPGKAQTGAVGAFVQQANPLAATTHFLAKILVNNRTFDEMWPWVVSPALLAALVVGLLLSQAGGLRLEGGAVRRVRADLGRAAAVFLAASWLLGLGPVASAQEGAAPSGASAAPAPRGPSLQIAIDLQSKVVKAGDPVLYDTRVTNAGAEKSPPLTVAMNIINLDARGEVVDPEDWSPQRTQYLESLAPGQSADLSWRVNAILDGDYMVYMVVIPKPEGRETTSHPVASSGIHLTVTPFTRLNPGGVLPYAVGGPILVGLVIFAVYRWRHRSIDMGGPS